MARAEAAGSAAALALMRVWHGLARGAARRPRTAWGRSPWRTRRSRPWRIRAPPPRPTTWPTRWSPPGRLTDARGRRRRRRGLGAPPRPGGHRSAPPPPSSPGTRYHAGAPHAGGGACWPRPRRRAHLRHRRRRRGDGARAPLPRARPGAGARRRRGGRRLRRGHRQRRAAAHRPLGAGRRLPRRRRPAGGPGRRARRRSRSAPRRRRPATSWWSSPWCSSALGRAEAARAPALRAGREPVARGRAGALRRAPRGCGAALARVPSIPLRDNALELAAEVAAHRARP